MSYTDELGRSLVTDSVLRALKNDGKIANLDDVRVPGSEVAPAVEEEETVLACSLCSSWTAYSFCISLISSQCSSI